MVRPFGQNLPEIGLMFWAAGRLKDSIRRHSLALFEIDLDLSGAHFGSIDL
jgi:hypothetical protein